MFKILLDTGILFFVASLAIFLITFYAGWFWCGRDWDAFIRKYRLGPFLFPNMGKYLRAARWFQVPGLVLFWLFFLPTMAVLTLMGRVLKKPGDRPRGVNYSG